MPTWFFLEIQSDGSGEVGVPRSSSMNMLAAGPDFDWMVENDVCKLGSTKSVPKLCEGKIGWLFERIGVGTFGGQRVLVGKEWEAGNTKLSEKLSEKERLLESIGTRKKSSSHEVESNRRILGEDEVDELTASEVEDDENDENAINELFRWVVVNWEIEEEAKVEKGEDEIGSEAKRGFGFLGVGEATEGVVRWSIIHTTWPCFALTGGLIDVILVLLILVLVSELRSGTRPHKSAICCNGVTSSGFRGEK